MAGEDAHADDLTGRSASWLVSRARTLTIKAQQAPVEEQPAALADMDVVLAEARRRGEPELFAWMLANTAGTRVASAGAGHRADHLIAELLDCAREHKLWLDEAQAHAFLARQAVFAGRDENALTHVATALAVLDQGGERAPWLPHDEWLNALGGAANDVGLVLTQLGLFEQAAPLLERAQRLHEEAGNVHNLTVRMVNRVRLSLAWGLWLERTRHDAEAAEKFATAADLARAVEQTWHESLFPNRDRPAAEGQPVVGAALAMADPAPGHLDRLRGLLARSMYARERITVGIAMARCLDRDGRHAEAVEVLHGVRGSLLGDSSEPSLAVSLAYETARLSLSVPAKRAYADALEAELWTLHEARVATVGTRFDRCGRSPGGGQPSRDPLTGLPDRHALADLLGTAVNHPEWLPLAVAVVDLDGPGDGGHRDAVRCAVAETLRSSLRGDDVVARHGGAEFCVVLPLTTLAAAEAVLTRAARAVAALPAEQGRGVTVWIGVTAAQPGDSADAIMARADATMRQARRQGRNRVRTGGTDQAPHDG